ncbi:peptidase M20 domain-containing protein 2-like [Littorina saxatilis]|uniref:Peptidase M20 domain-containing protein 2 n=1 Tax=Littorina saxatilis TaxID=31220 RepID=A0AAN9BR90_9CAEN
MANEQKLKKIACEVIDGFSPQLKNLSRDIWNHPELCFEEKYAHKRITDFLQVRGFNVERSYKLDTAFRAQPEGRSTGDGPNVAVLCEYDALPEIGHACGHNLIATVGVAASLGIQAALQSPDFQGKGMLTVLGTPAEEGGGGKVDLINSGAFADVDVAMMAHPSQFNLEKPVYLAMTEIKISYHGKASHASSYPWNGINALDAAVLCYTNISHLRQQIKPTWRAHGVITNGGAKPNIIPELAELEYYIRAPTDTELVVLKEKVVGCIEGAATATGCKVTYKFDPKPYSSLMSNDLMASLYVENSLQVGVNPERDPEKMKKAGGSTDMGNVSHVVPSIHPKYYIGTTVSAHSHAFAQQTKTEEAEDYSLAVAKALAMTGIDLLLKPELVQQAKQTFKEALEAELAAA